MAKLAEKKQKQYRTMFDVNNIPGRRSMSMTSGLMPAGWHQKLLLQPPDTK